MEEISEQQKYLKGEIESNSGGIQSSRTVRYDVKLQYGP